MPIKGDAENSQWIEFRDTGLLWWVNEMLYLFGWTIVFSTNVKNGEVSIYPAKSAYKSFDEKNAKRGYKTVKKYLSENAGSNYNALNEMEVRCRGQANIRSS